MVSTIRSQGIDGRTALELDPQDIDGLTPFSFLRKKLKLALCDLRPEVSQSAAKTPDRGKYVDMEEAEAGLKSSLLPKESTFTSACSSPATPPLRRFPFAQPKARFVEEKGAFATYQAEITGVNRDGLKVLFRPKTYQLMGKEDFIRRVEEHPPVAKEVLFTSHGDLVEFLKSSMVAEFVHWQAPQRREVCGWDGDAPEVRRLHEFLEGKQFDGARVCDLEEITKPDSQGSEKPKWGKDVWVYHGQHIYESAADRAEATKPDDASHPAPDDKTKDPQEVPKFKTVRKVGEKVDVTYKIKTGWRQYREEIWPGVITDINYEERTFTVLFDESEEIDDSLELSQISLMRGLPNSEQERMERSCFNAAEPPG